MQNPITRWDEVSGIFVLTQAVKEPIKIVIYKSLYIFIKTFSVIAKAQICTFARKIAKKKAKKKALQTKQAWKIDRNLNSVKKNYTKLIHYEWGHNKEQNLNLLLKWRRGNQGWERFMLGKILLMKKRVVKNFTTIHLHFYKTHSALNLSVRGWSVKICTEPKSNSI